MKKADQILVHATALLFHVVQQDVAIGTQSAKAKPYRGATL